MKKQLLYIAIAFLAVHFTTAQVLYTEDFESYNTGPFSNDLTGTTPAQGGWYTWVSGVNITPSIDNIKIVADPNKGNVLKLLEGYQSNSGGYHFYRTDLNTYWQQRTPGNNVLKISFDIYTDWSAFQQMFSVALYNDKELLVNFCYNSNFEVGSIAVPLSRGVTYTINCFSTLQRKLPLYSWVTIEMYIDYDNDKVYFSVPSLNHTVTTDTYFPLSLTAGGEHVDNPVKILLRAGAGSNNNTTAEIKIDNINISAQNTVPTVSVEEFISGKFNLFPNPTTNIVTITNSENIGIETITVYDTNGKMVKEQHCENENEVSLNIENLATGTYLLHIQTNKGTAVKKVLKK